MDYVALDAHGEVTADGTGLCFASLCDTDDFADGIDTFQAFPGGDEDGAGLHEFAYAGEEGFICDVGVVFFEGFGFEGGHFAGDELEAFALETVKDFSDETALDGVWFDHDESSFHFGWVRFR